MKPVDIVYVLGAGSKYNNSEIRYSMRSVVKHLSNFANVVIVGNCPNFARNLIHLPCQDKNDVPDLNIRDKILVACNSPIVSEDFLFMNDDHFFLNDFNAAKFPNYHKGDLGLAIAPRSMDAYRTRLLNTLNQLKNQRFPTLNFDIHTPILYNKEKFINMVKQFDWRVKEGLVVKSLYGNFYGLKAVQGTDYKVSGEQQINPQAPCFSTHATVSTQMQRFFQEVYPTPTKYEY